MLKLKLRYFDYLMQRADSLEKTLMLRKTEGMRRRRPQRTKWLDGIINLMNMSLSKFQELVKDKKDWHAAVHGITKSQTLLSDWATNNCNIYWNCAFIMSQMIKVGNTGSIPGLGRSPGEENGNQLQYSWLENSMNRGVWKSIVMGSQRAHNWATNILSFIYSQKN